MPRSGEIGEKIFDDVEKLVAGGMNRSQAFAKISADTGRRAGTVAANYYRVARKRAGGSLRPRSTRTTRTARSSSSSSAGRSRRAATGSSRDIDAIADELVRNIQALAAAVKANSAETNELRARLDGVKKMLG